METSVGPALAKTSMLGFSWTLILYKRNQCKILHDENTCTAVHASCVDRQLHLVFTQSNLNFVNTHKQDHTILI